MYCESEGEAHHNLSKAMWFGSGRAGVRTCDTRSPALCHYVHLFWRPPDASLGFWTEEDCGKDLG